MDYGTLTWAAFSHYFWHQNPGETLFCSDKLQTNSAIGVSKGPIDYYPSSVFMCDCVCAFFKNIVKLTIQELVLAIHITAEPSLQARSIFCAVDGSSSNIDSLQSSGKTTEGQLR